MFKYNLIKIKEYILIFLTATIFLFNSTSELSSKENIFFTENIQVEGIFDVNFSRKKFIDKAFRKSFKKLLSNILLSKDVDQLNNLNLSEIKNLIQSFKILDERFKNNKYFATFEVLYSDTRIKKLLRKKNISFFETKNAVVIFFPILVVQNEIKIFDENYFYNNWLSSNFKDEIIKFILPIADLDDILSVNKIKDQIENLDFENMAVKYNTKNYVVAIMNHESDKLKVYLKTNLDEKKYNKNIFYKLSGWNDKPRLNSIINDLRVQILDMWKRANLINIPLPLNIQIKFLYNNLKEIHNLEKALNEMNMINTYSLEKFNIKNSFFKINYYGDPKKLRDEFYRFNYYLKNNKGYWELEINE